MFRRALALLAPPAEVVSALKILGLKEGANASDVRSSYLKLARAHHPDLEGGDDKKMKIINVAYETLQLHGTGSSAGHAEKAAQSAAAGAGAQQRHWYGEGGAGAGGPSAGADPSGGKGRRHQTKRMADIVDDEFDTWNTKTDLDWKSAVSDVSPEDAMNPANNPRSYSRFFTMEDDATIYRMLRGGATIPQVARAIAKPATFIGKRVHNAQFKLRIQEVMRLEKKGVVNKADPLANGAAGATIRRQRTVGDNAAEDFWEHGFTKKHPTEAGGLDSGRVLSKQVANYANFMRFNKMKDRDPRRRRE